HQLPVSVLTFQPEPEIYFNNTPVFRRRLLTIPDKLRIISSLGMDNVYNIEFTENIAEMEAAQFIRKVLLDSLNCRAIFVGDDFRFGRGRAGDASVLKKFEETGLDVNVFSSLKIKDIPVGSSLIREKIVTGELDDAREMLGRPYTICESFQHGSGRGRKLGFPTLNFSFKRTIRPRFGVYLVWLGRSQRIPSVASFGVHPTVDQLSEPVLEVHTLEESPVLNPAQKMHIYFEKFCRPEEKFSSLDELKKRIGRDVQQARRSFAKLEKPAPVYSDEDNFIEEV
ncbi:MAG: riboflavin biosynthesis protein RibF, partial [bacterium]